MNERTTVTAASAPAAVGPYSHAASHGGVLYCSGALPLDPRSGEMAAESPATETRQCLRNLASVCEAGGTELAKALRLTVFTTDLGSFAEINEAYGEFFASDPPARVTVEVAALPLGARVEIDALVAAG
jgi:2-iminobutanoate/2-iminopropanoate deaminase